MRVTATLSTSCTVSHRGSAHTAAQRGKIEPPLSHPQPHLPRCLHESHNRTEHVVRDQLLGGGGVELGEVACAATDGPGARHWTMGWLQAAAQRTGIRVGWVQEGWQLKVSKRKDHSGLSIKKKTEAQLSAFTITCAGLTCRLVNLLDHHLVLAQLHLLSPHFSNLHTSTTLSLTYRLPGKL